MGAYLGPKGQMIEFVHWRSRQNRSVDKGASYETTIGGTRKAMIDPFAHRSWSMTAEDATPEEAAPFELLMAGAYGPPPWVFIDPMAQVTNVLTPRMSIPGAGNEFAYGVGSATVATIPGIGKVPGVLVPAGSTLRVAGSSPIVAGMPVTASVYAQGTATITLTAQFLNSTGGWTHNKKGTIPAGSWGRPFATDTALATDAEVDIRVTSTAAFTVALPAITWTSKLMPWSRGRGCQKAIITGYDDSYELAGENDDRLSTFKFKVEELGNGA